MRYDLRRAARALTLVACLTTGAAGCDDFLTGENLTRDPNAPSVATRDQLFVAYQAAQFGQQTANVPQFACLVMQQCAGNGNYVEGYYLQYSISNASFDLDFNQTYVGGGLVDIRQVQSGARAAGDSVYLGIAQVWEALGVSFAADNFGDIPYSQAVNSAEPAFDKQLDVYDDLQELLDRAIVNLGGPGGGPGSLDLVYGGDKAKWRQAAHTLKARLHMHTAEVRGASAYTAAIAAATNGIGSSTNDFKTSHGDNTNERNMWYQFSLSTFGQYIKAGKALVDIMEARNDTVRLQQYFTPVGAGPFNGNDYEGLGVTGGTPPDKLSEIATAAAETRITPNFRQPILTWEENQLILAEARFQTAGAGAAQPHLDAVRAANKLSSVPATLQAIAEEQYVSYYQNLEAWQSYKRLCYPNLAPATGQTMIPARVYYGSTEENANSNTPNEGEQDANGGVGKINGGAASTGSTAGPGRNPNDPAGGTVNAAAACLGS